MARADMVLLPLILSLFASSVLSADNNNSTKSKRQIFREQVNPQAGGRIPEDAFRSDRLALNRLNKEGIAVPDGVVLEARHRESHYGSHRHDPDIQASIVKVVLGEDGRYAPPEGRYPFNSLVESTYVLRPSINTPVIVVPPQRPHLTTLRLPARPFFQPEQTAFNSIDQHLDFFNNFDPNFPGNGLWTGLLSPVPDVPNRLLRRQAKIPLNEVAVKQNFNQGTKFTGNQAGVQIRSQADRAYDHHLSSTHEGRSLKIFHYPTRYVASEQNLKPSLSYNNAPPASDRTKDDYGNRLVPVYLTTNKESNYNSQNILIPNISQNPNYQHALQFNAPPSNHYHHSFQNAEPQSRLPAEKTVTSPSHYVLSPNEINNYNPQEEKTLVPIHQQTNIKTEDDKFQSAVQSPQVESALFEDYDRGEDNYKDTTPSDQPNHSLLEDSFSNPIVPQTPDQHSQHQFNVLVPVSVAHNRPFPLVHNQFDSNTYVVEPNVKTPNSGEKQDVQYQLVNSFSSLDTEYHNRRPFQTHEYNHLVKPNHDVRDNTGEINKEFAYQDGNTNKTENNPHQNYHNFHQNHDSGSTQNGFIRTPEYNVQHAERWHQPSANSLKIISQEHGNHDTKHTGIQYVRSGLNFEVVKERPGVRQQSRGEVGQKTLSNANQDSKNNRGSKSSDQGSKHLNQVLHYIEPHEVVQQISTAPSIEHEYPSLETVPETSFTCSRTARTMLPDPETSCQVFHLCNGDGSKESFLCPKGSRYDANKQQCASWTEVPCHA